MKYLSGNTLLKQNKAFNFDSKKFNSRFKVKKNCDHSLWNLLCPPPFGIFKPSRIIFSRP